MYSEFNLNKCRRVKKKLPTPNPAHLTVPVNDNQSWAIDFMSDSLFCGRRFRTFDIVDEHNIHLEFIGRDSPLQNFICLNQAFIKA